jgi:hypothetical protein
MASRNPRNPRTAATEAWHTEQVKALALAVLGPVLLAGAFGGLAIAWLW